VSLFALVLVCARNLAPDPSGSENGTWIIRASRKNRVEADEEVQDGDAVAWGNLRTQIFWPGSLFGFLTTLLDPRAAPGHE